MAVSRLLPMLTIVGHHRLFPEFVVVILEIWPETPVDGVAGYTPGQLR